MSFRCPSARASTSSLFSPQRIEQQRGCEIGPQVPIFGFSCFPCASQSGFVGSGPPPDTRNANALADLDPLPPSQRVGLLRLGEARSADLLDAEDSAARDLAGFLPLPRDVHDDHGAVPGCFWRDAHVGRAPILIMDGEHDLSVRPSLGAAR